MSRRSSRAAIDAVDAAVGLALQADAGGGIDALRHVAAGAFSGGEARFRSTFLERFDRRDPAPVPAASGDELVDAVVDAFRTYWWHALTDRHGADAHAARLLDRLHAVIGEAGETLDGLEPAVRRRLEERHAFALLGETSPLRELMVWRSRETRTYDVVLPEGRHTTRVELLDDFVSLGWSDYATCGRRGTGGWATRDGLFAVVPRYAGGLDGETFQVTFLGHESQHFADLVRFGEMEPWVLEYRAKLVELALAVETRGRILRMLGESQGDDAAVPHAYANRRVLEARRARLALAPGRSLATVAAEAMQAAALDELRADSASRTGR